METQGLKSEPKWGKSTKTEALRFSTMSLVAPRGCRGETSETQRPGGVRGTEARASIWQPELGVAAGRASDWFSPAQACAISGQPPFR